MQILSSSYQAWKPTSTNPLYEYKHESKRWNSNDVKTRIEIVSSIEKYNGLIKKQQLDFDFEINQNW